MHTVEKVQLAGIHVCGWLQITVIDTEGNFVKDLLSDERHSISQPKALAVYDKRLYYLDPRYERLERVDISSGENSKILLDNEPDLKTFTIFRKRPSESNWGENISLILLKNLSVFYRSVF